MERQNRTEITRVLALTSASLVCLISVVVIYGWFSNNLILVQIHPEFVSMKFNTALLFFVTGVGLCLTTLQYSKAAMFCGVSVAIFAIATLSQSIFNVDLYLDRLFIKEDITIHNLAPGRMAVNTAICFSLSGIAIVITASKRVKKHIDFAESILGSLIFALGSAALLGYGVGLDTEFGWGRYTAMAVHTASAFLMIGISLISIYFLRRTVVVSSLTSPLIVVVTTVLLTLSATLSVAVRTQQEQLVRSEMQGEIDRVILSFQKSLKLIIDPMARSAERWKLRGGIPKEQWYAEAESYVSTFPEVRAAEWITKDFIISWIVPLAGNEAVKDFDLKIDPKRHAVIQAAKEKNQFSISQTIALKQGGLGLILYQPLYKETEFDGFFASVVDMEKFFRQAISEIDPKLRLQLQIFEGEKTIFSYPTGSDHKATGHPVETVFETYGKRLKIVSAYIKHKESRMYSVLPYVIFIIGILVSVLVYISIYNLLQSKKLLRIIQFEHQRFAQVFEATPSAMMLYGTGGKIQFANSATSSLLGYSSDNLLNKDIAEILPNLNIPLTQISKDELTKFRKYHSETGQITQAKHRNNQEIPVEFDFSLVDSLDENFVLVSLHDLTERMKREEQLQETNEALDRTSRMAQVGGWELDLSTNKLLWSSETYRIHGLPESYVPVVDQAIDFYAPEARPLIEQAVEQGIVAGEPWDLELPFIKATGEKIWVRAKGEVKYKNNKPTRLVGAFQDITDRRKALEDLETRNEELNRFTYAASHDLRAPLRGISQLTQWLSEDLDGKIDADSVENLNLIQSRIKRLDSLLNDLLFYARAGRKNGEISEVKTHELISEVFELSKANTSFSITIDGINPIFNTYKTPFEFVIRNLISNAIKHHLREDGKICVDVGEQGDNYIFRVMDDGEGIEDISKDRIFDMFQTLKPRDEVEGSGMGLTIIKKTVESFGGTITVTDNVPSGAIFTFTWPKNVG